VNEHQLPAPIAYRYATFADLIGVHRDTVRRWAREGKIRTVVIGSVPLIPASEVERLLGEAA
jgi:putative resolvase